MLKKSLQPSTLPS